MHDALVVQLSDANDDLCGIKLNNILIKSLLLLENLVQLTAINERHDEVETGVRLEQVLHTAEEGVISLKENVLLQSCGLYLIILDQHILPDRLDGELLASGW